MLKIKKGDTVQVTKGDDKGKKGRVLKIFAQESRALIEGINLMKKHKRRTRDDQKGGIVSTEAPMQISNLMVFCKQCNKPAKVGFTLAKDKTKSRYCKSCKEAI
jgi:large subunit ribosomal protein L24